MSKYLSLVFVIAAACGGAETPAEKPESQTETQPAPKASADDPHAVCVQAFQRQRECADVFIPALVDARVRRDSPPGVAAKDQELGRDKLVEMAFEEYKTDSTDAAIEETCTRMEGNMPPDQLQSATQQVGQCLDAEGCTAFVECLIPVIEPRL